MRVLSKSKLLAYRQCPKRLWLEIHRPELRDDSAATQAHFARLRAGIQAGAEALAEHDRLPTHRFGDRGVFALGVAGDVDAAPERQRPRIQ